MDLKIDENCSLLGLSKINILLGKNGCGKSSLLKKLELNLVENKNFGEVNYVTPERGGTLNYHSGIEQSVINDISYSKSNKRVNQWGMFKHYSVTQYNRLQLKHLIDIEKNRSLPGFDTVIDRINSMLINVKIVRKDEVGFELYTKEVSIKLKPEDLSSGESELISLAIECLAFEKDCKEGVQNILLLDEPDVHLHPDLQANFIYFLIELLESNKFKVIIATHSTAILGALKNYNDSRFSILINGGCNVLFKPINEVYKKILPIFGAHPLTNLFNESPILLVEGDDDVRIWQQAIRTSKGEIKFYPCSVGGVDYLTNYESSTIEIINGVYDKAKAFSLRDRDNGDENIDDIAPLVRFKLSCRASENLLLTDEVLASLNLNWPQLQELILVWLTTFPYHPKFPIMNNFKDSGFDRKKFDLKELRNIIIGLTETAKPWEVVVGQVIGKIAIGDLNKDFSPNKICNYLGEKLTSNL
jgi:energy-coupling factor transporter ATP-binding protein EcfA2